MAQKRKDRRIKRWCKTAVEPAPGGNAPRGKTPVDAFTCDLSLAGARLHSKEPFEVGSIVRLKIELVRSRETLTVNARIKWVKENGAEGIHEMGVEFLHAASSSIMCLMKDLHGMNV